MAEALRTTYWVPQIGSKFARLACGTKRKVRAAAPCESAGIERPPVAARLPTPANPFNTVLRSIMLSQSWPCDSGSAHFNGRGYGAKRGEEVGEMGRSARL